MKCRCWLIIVGALLALGQSLQAQITLDIHVFNFDFGTSDHVAFDPTIQLGDTIRWVWDDNGGHTSTSAAGQAESWDSGVLSSGSTFSHTFTSLGTFNYYCIPHGVDLGGGRVDGMSGSITVVPEPETWGLAAGCMLLAFGLARRFRLNQRAEA